MAWILLAAFLYVLKEKHNNARELKTKMIQGKEIKFDVKVGGGFILLLLSTRNSNK